MPSRKRKIEADPSSPKRRTSKKTMARKGHEAMSQNPCLEEHRSKSQKLQKFIGAHVSASGGVDHAVMKCAEIGGTAFALFLKNQRRWDAPPLSPESIAAFKRNCEEHGIDPRVHVLPHGSYLINLANPDADKLEKAFDGFMDDLRRCEALGILKYNFHPGSSLDGDRNQAIRQIADSINRAHRETKFVVPVIENMAGQGRVIGGSFSDIAAIIGHVEDRNRVGVCLDTCHMFAAGYDIRTPEKFDAMLDEFDRAVGLKYLMGMHLNDSKAHCGSALDRHESLGQGAIGMATFEHIAKCERLRGIPLILETPDESRWASEIASLYECM